MRRIIASGESRGLYDTPIRREAIAPCSSRGSAARFIELGRRRPLRPGVVAKQHGYANVRVLASQRPFSLTTWGMTAAARGQDRRTMRVLRHTRLVFLAFAVCAVSTVLLPTPPARSSADEPSTPPPCRGSSPPDCVEGRSSRPTGSLPQHTASIRSTWRTSGEFASAERSAAASASPFRRTGARGAQASRLTTSQSFSSTSR
jgi:hypothetical protein